jgi:hypothetical protein
MALLLLREAKGDFKKVSTFTVISLMRCKVLALSDVSCAIGWAMLDLYGYCWEELKAASNCDGIEEPPILVNVSLIRLAST